MKGYIVLYLNGEESRRKGFGCDKEARKIMREMNKQVTNLVGKGLVIWMEKIYKQN